MLTLLFCILSDCANYRNNLFYRHTPDSCPVIDAYEFGASYGSAKNNYETSRRFREALDQWLTTNGDKLTAEDRALVEIHLSWQRVVEDCWYNLMTALDPSEIWGWRRFKLQGLRYNLQILGGGAFDPYHARQMPSPVYTR